MNSLDVFTVHVYIYIYIMMQTVFETFINFDARIRKVIKLIN